MKLLKRVGRFVLKVFAYLPVLWRDEDYDYSHIISLLQYKLKRTRIHILKHNIITDAQEVATQIAYAETLIQHLRDDDYLPELYQAHEEKWGKEIDLSEPSKEHPGYYTWDMRREKAITPELEEQELEELREIYRKMAEAQEQDWNELWTHLNKELRNWWD